MTVIIETERLILRTWRQDDAHAYYCINQDARVIEFLRGPLSLEQVNDFMLAMNQQQAMLKYTLWATELKATAELIGFIGLNYTDFLAPFDAHFTPAVEIGWRLGSQYWGNGYATEGAKAALAYGFCKIGLDEIVAFTAAANARSSHVMEKIGLTRNRNDDFLHPKLPLEHPLSRHILYRLTNDDYLQKGRYNV